MPKKLSTKDYKLILTHYGRAIPKSKIAIKKMAETLVTQKLCSCIKKITKTTSKTLKKRNYKNNTGIDSVGICTASILKNRGMKYSTFSCKKRKITNLKKTRKITFRKIPFRGKI
jgi:hypothetical protein